MTDKQALKIAIITDIHHGPRHFTKLGDTAITLLENFCTFAGEWRADIAVDLGDRISDIDHPTDRKHLHQVATVFHRLRMPRGHILGNHDRENLKVEDNAELLGVDMISRVVRLNGFNLVFWQANTQNFWPDGLNLLPGDLDWLRQTLCEADSPCIIFTHVPLDTGSMAGNYYFDQNPRHATYPEAEKARTIIQASNKVVLCVAGHVHWNSVNIIHGIPYLALHSLTECSTTYPDPSMAWATLEFGSDSDLHWKVYGNDSWEIVMPMPDRRHAWLFPLLPGFVSREGHDRPATLNHIKAVLFDLDGVFYQGEKPLPGGKQIIEFLRQDNHRFLALTNNSQRHPMEIAAQLNEMGVNISAEEILTSSDVLIRQLTANNKKPKVFIIGSQYLRDALLAAGAVESNHPEYVIVGWDHDVRMEMLKTAVAHVLNGAEIAATNGDCLIPTQNGLEPENGALIAFLERASGKKARVFGKPHGTIFEMAMERLQVKADETVMVGDNLETDILGANLCGLQSVFINPSGCHSNSAIKPTFEIHHLGNLVELMKIGTDP